MPHTPNGKIDRKAFKFNYADLEKNIVLPKNAVEQQLYDIILNIVKNDNISMEDDLFSIGIDSIGMIHLSTKIEHVFGINISIKELYNIKM